jgi:peptidoglycan/xylan/chitin deacetylase (PgdA/CDA1 family)
MYGYDAPAAAQVKYLLNIALPADVRGELVDELFGDDEAFAKGLYMDRGQVEELEARGLVGAHAWAHRPLAKLDDAELRSELERSAALFAEHPRAISYPYGTPDAVDERVAAAAAEAGFEVGFTMEAAYNRSLEQPLLLARIDVNDAPGGSHANPERIAPGRTRYFTETAGFR